MKSDQSWPRRFIWLVFSFFLAAPLTLLADNGDVSFSGFASLAYAKTLNSGDGPLNNISDEGEYRDFNTLGLRMNAELHERVSFTAQMVSYGQENYEPEFDWIFASIDLAPEWRLDVGRSRVPMFMYSDVIDVGYAYQWVKPPSTVYVAGRSFFQSVEGLKLNYVTTIADWESELLAFGGRTEEHFTSLDGTEQVDLYIDNMSGAAWTVERDWLALRAVYAQGDVTIEGYSSYERLLSTIDTLTWAINTAEPYVDQDIDVVDASGFRDMVDLRQDTLKFASVGASVDFDKVFAVIEIAQSLFDDNIAVNDSAGGYLTVGVRFPHRVTLSGTIGERHQDSNKNIMAAYADVFAEYEASEPLSTSSTDETVKAAVKTANQFLDDTSAAYMGAIIDNAVKVAQDKSIHEYSMQLRWDFHRAAAFKFEYLLQHNHQYSSVNYLRETVSPQAFRIGVDVVF